MAIYEGSRYVDTPVLKDKEGRTYFKRRENNKYNKDIADSHIWKETDSLDYIAYFYYSDPSLWWVILEANPKYSLETDIQIGDKLIIPNYEEVVKIFE